MVPDPLTLAAAALRKWLLEYSRATWQKSPGLDDNATQLLVSRMVPAVQASQMKMANLVAASASRDYGIPQLPPDEELITLGRGVDPKDVYLRPIVTARAAVADGKSYDEARADGLDRLESLATTDLQMAKVRQFDTSLKTAQKTFYRRVPKGASTCALCLIAATQPYTVGNLLPIHPGCDCGVEAIPPGMHLDDLLDPQKLLEATHAKVKAFTEIEDRGGRAVDYRKLLITHEHGEIGPLLAWDGQKFTGPKDIPGGAAGAVAKPSVTPISAETPADRARKLLPGLQKSLTDLRAQGLSEESSQVSYHKLQIEKHQAALADEAAKGTLRESTPVPSLRGAKTGPETAAGQPPKPPQPPVPPRQNGGVGDSGGDDDFKDHPDLSPEDRAEARAAAQAKREAAAAAEPVVSATLSDAVTANGGELERFDSRLKDEASLYRKIQDVMDENDVAADVAASKIRDSLRYTAVVSEKGYWAAGTRIGDALVAAGHQRGKVVSGWARSGYRGRNDTFITPEGVEYEVQIHTAASLKAAEDTHKLYEEERLPTTPPEKKAQLSAMQAAIFASVPAPDDIVWID
ncbi:hypothetical protein OS122_02555 [Mycolicibacterium mucogenicum]|uniref:hypothetical protein n=1 Tax=Mycolicibacterium mucogenicum TaxID=56689 RepID=UPI002269DD36|nr:hypothetical protein [Mycolicibacterium mucogenicum]MCX8559780.1 hypothetical protein [Mycolicibacterium mucogenicum]